jgi:hypothetical protein
MHTSQTINWVFIEKVMAGALTLQWLQNEVAQWYIANAKDAINKPIIFNTDLFNIIDKS